MSTTRIAHDRPSSSRRDANDRRHADHGRDPGDHDIDDDTDDDTAYDIAYDIDHRGRVDAAYIAVSARSRSARERSAPRRYAVDRTQWWVAHHGDRLGLRGQYLWRPQ